MKVFAIVCVALICSFADAQSAYSIGAPVTPPPEVLPNGFLADSPDVAAAKANHLYEVSKATYESAKAAYDAYYAEKSNDEIAPQPAIVQSLPIQQDATVLANGYIIDTPEVAAAKAAHSYEVSRASYLSAKALYDAYYSGSAAPAAPAAYALTTSNDAPVSYIPAEVKVLPNGYIADTPEVAAAKAAHSYEISRAEYAAAKAAYDAYYAGSAIAAPVAYSDAPVAYSYRAPAPVGYSLVPYPVSYYTKAYTPPAEITVLPDGHIADTPEVAQAKLLHNAAKAKAEAEAAIAQSIAPQA